MALMAVSPAGGTDLNLSPSSIAATRNCAPSPAHAALTTSKSSTLNKAARSATVHWDRGVFDPSVKSDTDPEAQENKASPSTSTQDLEWTLGSQDPRTKPSDKKSRGHRQRPQLAAETFTAPDVPAESIDSLSAHNESFGEHDLVKAARGQDPQENIFEKHKKKHFQWVLSLPASVCSNPDQPLQPLDDQLNIAASCITDQSDRRYFGCNLLTWTKAAGRKGHFPGDPDDEYLLLATPIELAPEHTHTTDLETTSHRFRVLGQEDADFVMATQMINSPASAANSATQSAKWSTVVDASEDSDNTLTIEPPRRLMTAPMSTIEDSLEEIDQLEDEFEAVTAATRVAQISNAGEDRPRDRAAKHSPYSNPASKVTTPNGKAASKTASAVRGEPNASSPCSPARKSSPPKTEPEAERKTSLGTATKRVARPASLAPPKPLQRASKAPTVPTFELPGERVARELKEKKAARLSMQLDSPKVPDVKTTSQRLPSFRSSKPPTVPEFELPGERVARELKEKKAARLSMQLGPQKLAESSPPPQRVRSVRSSKPPTVPNFELPGESVSRMKKERLAAKLKAEEEEVQRRRQFKARPPPSSVGGSATVRSTFTSRQRESQGGAADQQSTVSPSGASPKYGTTKRHSVAMTPTAGRTVSNASASTVQTNRGRTSSVGSSHFSARATSSSNASIVSASKRSQVSSEEIQEQKARGREIYTRDNSYGQDKEREKRERQQAIQLARQKYAEQSRMLATSRRLKQQQTSTA
ncbi:hypothetical protein KVR01_009989 [Diaporthe batatas]|uniref:uncharacterized protein n=1 Tax=Diaporthe batatas TaxID=748121 RepID=UPI001D057E8B|nr:uncharacterized protein KVR01_009989 [Diaporthe batatas]KAG8160453.1 hypothetical protein KVR01_009989 [Diaporthe batatas]